MSKIIQAGSRRVSLDVSLRGTLADEYVRRARQDRAMADAWVRAICNEATTSSNHPTFIVKMDTTDMGKLIIGKRLEVGMYPPDW